MMTTQEVIAAVRERLVEYYGERFRGLVLYGSMARGTAHADSDIDLLVLLDGEVDIIGELWEIVKLVYPLQLESEYRISCHPADHDMYTRGDWELYRNAKREGVSV